jgi:predicted Ser/Thr protein kinase
MPAFCRWDKERRQQSELAAAVAGAVAAGAAGRRSSGVLLLLPLLAASTAVAAAVLAGRSNRMAGAWRPAWLQRRLCSQNSRTGAEEGLQLLRRKADVQQNDGPLQRRLPKPGELAPGRARLKALAQRQLGGTALLSGRAEAQLLSVLKGTAHTFERAAASGCTPASDGNPVQPERPGSAAYRVGFGGQQVRHWGLPTDSLRIQATDLQILAEADGSLVQLGEGAHGVVFLAQLQDSYVAVKVMEIPQETDSRAFWNEVAMLRRCVHSRIVPVYGVAVQGPLLMVAMQLMLGGSLRAALADPEQLDKLRWSNRGQQVAVDVAEAVAYLHEEAHVLHSDIKSGNVLLSQDWRAALSDLGVAQAMESAARTAVGGSNLYAAPEQLLGERCTLAADIYSLGLLLTELTTRRFIMMRGEWELPQPPDDCPQDVADLIGQCLSSDPRQRPTAAEVLRRLRASGGSGDGS